MALLFLTACGDPAPPAVPSHSAGSDFVGRAACLKCHEKEMEAWRGSHHDLAMQEATAETVLGNFGGATVTVHGVTSTFSRRGERFIVTTEGDDGALHDYEVAYVFGVTPLQQYLVAFPGGRYQTLPLCWDSRPYTEGGRRWFHIYPDEHIAPGDELYWTGRVQNWNYMCAECHSTDLRRGYDLETDSYTTTWAEIDVSCEACHGPGAAHVDWAEGHEGSSDYDADDPMGLVVNTSHFGDAAWEIDGETGTAKLKHRAHNENEIDICARCHSRRGPLTVDYVHGRSLHETHRLSGLERHLYHADGQILDEVYVHGSFLQSKMYAAGVTCSDCHESHSLALRAEGNAVCGRCHLPSKFDVPEHHHHEQGTLGASCAECHMPPSNYMVVDPRHDHSLRIPRPDLSVRLGTPNACNNCHAEKTPEWSEEYVAKWYGVTRKTPPHYGETLHAGRTGAPGSTERLVALAGDAEQAPIVRAAALDLLARRPGPAAHAVAAECTSAADALVRSAAAGAFASYSYPERSPVVALLEDPVRAVRVAAARVLAGYPLENWDADTRQRFEAAFEDLEQAQLASAELPVSHVNLGNAYVERGRLEDAEASYLTALRLEPDFTPATVNLADLRRVQGRDAEAAELLRGALRKHPDDAVLLHALALTMVRLKQDGWLPHLAKAAELAPEQSQYAYTYAVALSGEGDAQRALAVLEQAVTRHPSDRSLLLALVTLHRDAGNLDQAIEFAERLVRASPDDADARRMLDALRTRRRPR